MSQTSSIYLVAETTRVYSCKNLTRTTRDFRELFEEFLSQNKTFSVDDMENISGDDRAISTISSDETIQDIHAKKDNNARKQAYYYISKLLAKKIIKKTTKYKKQGYGQKPLAIYEVVKFK